MLDLGSGAGNDCFVARHETGEDGRVIGVDFTPEMVAKAKEAVAEAFSAAHPDFELVPVPELLAHLLAEQGDEQVAAATAASLCSGPYMRLWPHRHNTDGFYAAVWQRRGLKSLPSSYDVPPPTRWLNGWISPALYLALQTCLLSTLNTSV